jgi:thiol:disulfide interchange protein DsbD
MRYAWTLVTLMTLLAAQAAVAQFGAGPKMETKAVAETDGVGAGGTVRVAISANLEEGWHVNANKPLEEFLIPTELTFPEDPRFTLKQVTYPEHKLFTFAFSPEPLAVYEHNFTVYADLTIAADAPVGDLPIEASLRYQACNDKQCAPPKSVPVAIALRVLPAGETGAPQAPDAAPAPADAPAPAPDAPIVVEAAAANWTALSKDFEIAGVLSGYAVSADFIQFLEDAEAGRGTTGQNYLAGQGLWLMLVLVLAGGLALNLTPCVLPLIPINIAIIGAGARAGSKSRGFALGAMYGLGIALVYGALGLVVVLGVSNAFGNLSAVWWFNLGIAVFFVVLALAMFDIVQIDFSRWQAKFGIRKNEQGSFAVAFAMGGISALLAGACVAPVVIAVILQTQTLYDQGNSLALLLPFLLGVGMALPWPFAGAGLSFLPKPGVWMNRVKYGFGVFILVLAGWYGYEGWKQYGQAHLEPKGTTVDTHGWITNLEEGLAKAKSENKPVVIDFWATWCKNCIVMDETTFQAPAVIETMERFVKVKYQAEDPDASPAREVLEHFKVLGLPTYVVLKPKG